MSDQTIYVECPSCDGSGLADGRELCAVCGATGRVPVEPNTPAAWASYVRSAGKHLLMYYVTKGPSVLIEAELNRLPALVAKLQRHQRGVTVTI